MFSAKKPHIFNFHEKTEMAKQPTSPERLPAESSTLNTLVMVASGI
jgi:hypothetical protein